MNSPTARMDMEELGKFREAVDVARRALSAEPENSELLRGLADAIAEFGTMSGFNEESERDYHDLLDEAISIYATLLKLKPTDGVSLNNMGVAQSDRGYHQAAVESLRSAMIHLPYDRNATFNLAVALMNIGPAERQEARKHFQAASLLEPRTDTREAYFDFQGH